MPGLDILKDLWKKPKAAVEPVKQEEPPETTPTQVESTVKEDHPQDQADAPKSPAPETNLKPEATEPVSKTESETTEKPKQHLFSEVEKRIVRAKEPAAREPMLESDEREAEPGPELQTKRQIRAKEKGRSEKSVFQRYWWVFVGSAALLVGWGVWRYLRSRRRETGQPGGAGPGPQAGTNPGQPTVIENPAPRQPTIITNPQDPDPERIGRPTLAKDAPSEPYIPAPGDTAGEIAKGFLSDASWIEKERRRRRSGGA